MIRFLKVTPLMVKGCNSNEIVAHTDATNAPPLDSNDAIELFNTTGGDINLNNWYLSDRASNLKKWQIPGTLINGAGFLWLTERNAFNTLGTNGFGLNKAGERVYLSYLPGNANDRVADSVKFKGQENGASLGRYEDGEDYWFALTPTTNAANAQPTNRLVISEIMYHPITNGFYLTNNMLDEYIELLSRSPTSTP